MYRFSPTRCPLLPVLVTVALGLGLSMAKVSEAAIVGPVPKSFDMKDLDQTFNNKAQCGSSAPSQHLPIEEGDQKSGRLDYFKAAMPSGQNSSSSSSSSAGGPGGSNAALSVFSGTIAIEDDCSLGRLAEDHGISLPDPPGMDLLRPPRISG